MFRRLLLTALMAGLLSTSSGCCLRKLCCCLKNSFCGCCDPCCDPCCGDHCACDGCGEAYWGDHHHGCHCDPCDCCGNWVGHGHGYHGHPPIAPVPAGGPVVYQGKHKAGQEHVVRGSTRVTERKVQAKKLEPTPAKRR